MQSFQTTTAIRLFQLSEEINTANQKFPHLLTCFACFHRDLCRDLDLHHLNAFITWVSHVRICLIPNKQHCPFTEFAGNTHILPQRALASGISEKPMVLITLEICPSLQRIQSMLYKDPMCPSGFYPTTIISMREHICIFICTVCTT